MDFEGAAVTVDVPDGAIVDLSRGGSFENAGSAALHVGPESLVVLPAGGANPAAAFGSYSNAGMVHQAGTTLEIPEGACVRGRGSLDDPVICEGTLTTDPGGWIELNGGLTLSGNATVDLGGAKLTIADQVSAMHGGTLSDGQGYIGAAGTAVFTQTGGQSLVTGTFRAGDQSGSGLPGKYIQHGGVKEVQGPMYVGSASGSSYELKGGQLLACEDACIYGLFDHSGGTSQFAGSVGIDHGHSWIHTGGDTSMEKLYIGYGMGGTFRQKAGTVAVRSSLRLGRGGPATFQLEGGL